MSCSSIWSTFSSSQPHQPTPAKGCLLWLCNTYESQCSFIIFPSILYSKCSITYITLHSSILLNIQHFLIQHTVLKSTSLYTKRPIVQMIIVYRIPINLLMNMWVAANSFLFQTLTHCRSLNMFH